MPARKVRSLNLATATGIALYDALREPAQVVNSAFNHFPQMHPSRI